ncbi:MAG: hypothetical protein LWX11_03870, partial [Firmicutes bacterium]|nr:hypothetical protein [Bacillota bacterium]
MLARTLQLLCGLVLLSVGGLQAQVKVSGQQLYKAYGVEHGLENLTVGSIVQDPFGFIWVSTEGGVFRFDGKRFSEFGLKDGLPTVSATTLHVATDGTLWCGTFQGLCRYDQGRFIAVTESEGLSPDRVIALASGHDGHLLVATTHGLFEQGENGKFRLVEEVPSKLIAALHVSRKGGIIVAVWDKQVSSFYEKPLGASWRELEAKVDRTMRKATVHALGDDSEGALWARSTEHVWRKGPDEDGFVEMLKGQAATPIKATLGVDSQGRILAPTPQGVFRYEKGQWTSLGRLEGMPRNHIVAILEDREGSIWMGGLGLSRVRGGGIFKSYTKQDGLPSDTVWKIARDDWGNLYAGTEAGLARWENGRWNLVKGTGNICVLTLSRTPSGELMGATWPARLFIIQRNGSLRWISMATARLGSTGLPTALMDRQGSIWVGSITEGLQKGEKRGSQWIFEPVILPGGRKDERITCVIEDREGRLWVAGNSGLRIKDGGAWHHLTRKNGLRDDSIEGLTCASNGDVIISYSEPHGLARTRFSSQEGFRIVEHLDRW